jgi:hypothetical protein
VTIRDTNLPLSTDYFSKGFVGYKVASLIDFFSRYKLGGVSKRELQPYRILNRARVIAISYITNRWY